MSIEKTLLQFFKTEPKLSVLFPPLQKHFLHCRYFLVSPIRPKQIADKQAYLSPIFSIKGYCLFRIESSFWRIIFSSFIVPQVFSRPELLTLLIKNPDFSQFAMAIKFLTQSEGDS